MSELSEAELRALKLLDTPLRTPAWVRDPAGWSGPALDYLCSQSMVSLADDAYAITDAGREALRQFARERTSQASPELEARA